WLSSASISFIFLTSLTSMPPYLAFQLKNVGSLIPISRQISLTEMPVSCFLIAATIWLSVNLDFFILDSLQLIRLLYFKTAEFWVRLHRDGLIFIRFSY